MCARNVREITFRSPDVDVSALQREVGADSVATTPMRGMQTIQQRREEEAAALHRRNTQSSTVPARVQNPYFETLVCGRQFDDDSVIIQSPQARKPLDRMCVHAGDGQTYLVRVNSMS